MGAVSWTEVTGGVLVVGFTLTDLFRTAVLPRPSVGRLLPVPVLLRWLWKGWRWVGTRPARAATREGRLAVFGPFSVFVMFAGWAVALIVGYGLLFDGLRGGLTPSPTSFGESLYFSSATFVPLSYGDIVPVDVFTRIVSVLDSASGVMLGALVITLLFSLYQSFQQREQLVVALDAMAGAPASGVQILETAAERGMRRELVGTFDEWRRWTASVLESHLAFPILFYFRSSHDNEAWLNSFGAVMDAATLVISTLEEESSAGPAHLMLTVGKHLIDDSTWMFQIGTSTEPYVERSEYEEAVARLARAGFRCRNDDESWAEFARIRARYAHALNRMANWLAIVPAQWIGDRSYLPHQR